VTEIAVTIVSDEVTKDLQLGLGADSTGTAVHDAVAESIGVQPDRLSLVIERTGGSIDRGAPAAAAGVRWGDRILATTNGSRPVPAAPWSLLCIQGPVVGCRIALGREGTEVGRGSWGTELADPAMSRRQARFDASEQDVRVTDLGSTNGTLVNGTAIATTTAMGPNGRVTLGDSEFVLVRTGTTDNRAHLTYEDGRLGFARSVDVQPPPPAVTVTLPTPPARPPGRRFPVASAVVPIILGLVLYKVTHQTYILLFMALSPIMLIWSTLDDRRSGRKQFATAKVAFEAGLAGARTELAAAAAASSSWRDRSQPSPEDLVAAAVAHAPTVWGRPPRRDDFLHCRVGTADLASLTRVECPASGAEDLVASAQALADEFALDRAVPAVLPLRELGSVGLFGRPEQVHDAAAAIVSQLAILHSPRYLSLVVLAPERADAWGWAKWLPHVAGLAEGARAVAADQEEAADLWKLLGELATRRRSQTSDTLLGAKPAFMPHIVVVLEPPLRISPSELSRFLEGSTEVGISVLWVGTDRDLVPSECRSLLDVSGGTLTFVESGTSIASVTVEGLADRSACAMARALAPLVDTTADDASERIPDAVSLLDLLGAPGLTADDVQRWWSAPAKGLAAPVGVDGNGAVQIDLRRDGPHGLVAGSTGAGKSEFLQTLVAALALRHSPERINFILVDYKGGAAFKDCVLLPHTVGFVTDLDNRRTERARTSLEAELRRREHLLAQADAKDLADMLRKASGLAPPSLLIVVDEYAALKDEVPEFVDTVVDVARRGRSLGVHLVLATQTPEGVISKDIERNSDLRVALRLQNASESQQLIGTRAAVDIPKRHPGRALLRSGSSGLRPFQSAYVGGISVAQGPDPSAAAQTFRFSAAQLEAVRQLSGGDGDGPTDLKRIVLAVVETFARTGSPPPFRPWPNELSPVLPLADLPIATDRPDSMAVTVGMGEHLERQAQEPFVLDLSRTPTFAVYGSSGSGTTTFLRTVAAGLAIAHPPSNVHLYGLDAGGGGLRSIASLPHCGAVVAVEDTDRLRTLLAVFAEEAVRRSALLASSGAGSLEEHRRRTGDAPPAIVLLVDRFGTLWNTLEDLDRGEHADTLSRLLQDGRGIGIHVVLTADRRAALPPQLHNAISGRLVLRLGSVDEYGQLELPHVREAPDLPPGRGFLPGMHEVQVAVACATADQVDGPAQADELAHLATRVAEQHPQSNGLPPTVDALPQDAALEELPSAAHGTVFGIGGVGNRPVAMDLLANPIFLVTGPEGSGRSTTLATIVRSMERDDFIAERILVAGRRSPVLRQLGGWAEIGTGLPAATELLGRLAAQVSTLEAHEDDDDPVAAGPRRLIIIDDADEMTEGPVANALSMLLRRARDSGDVVLLSMVTSRAARSYGDWLNTCRSARHGILLQPDANDGDVFRIELPKRANLALPEGRGYLVTRSGVSLVQVAT
jgi:S-DNA-T family DNA segregation ATPase FtsK/SpoIIIE